MANSQIREKAIDREGLVPLPSPIVVSPSAEGHSSSRARFGALVQRGWTVREGRSFAPGATRAWRIQNRPQRAKGPRRRATVLHFGPGRIEGQRLIRNVLKDAPRHWARLRQKQTGRSVDPEDFRIGPEDLWRMAADPAGSYRRPRKRKGRTIIEPDLPLKAVQKAIKQQLDAVVRRIDSPISAFGKSTMEAALSLHGHEFMCTLDIENAFKAVNPGLVRRGLDAAGLNSDLLVGLLFRHGSLPPGAPSSNAALEIALAHSDFDIYEHAQDQGVEVVRWADDYGFAGNDRKALERVVKYAERRLRRDRLRLRSKEG